MTPTVARAEGIKPIRAVILPLTAGVHFVARAPFLLALVVLLSACSGQSGSALALQSTATPAIPPPSTPGVAVDLRSRIVPLLQSTWQGYKQDFVQSDGRVIDHARKGVTTSEGQAYALLRAVWTGDRPTFDLVWAWTHHNLQVRKHDRLFGYLWGKHRNGTWSLLSASSATDADEDIALALVFASHRWNDATYLHTAQRIIHDMWRHEVTSIHGAPVITAGNWATSTHGPGPQVDPSYFAPYAYRIFAKVDHADAWNKVVTSSYALLTLCTRAPLGEKKSVGLAPNWCTAKADGSVAPAHESRANVYGYDAFRVQWRIALDYLWNHDARALSYLKHASFLRTAWAHSHQLFSQYRHDGKPYLSGQDPTIYGGDLGNFIVTDPTAAVQIANDKLLATVSMQNGVTFWDQRYNYYEQNWVWFGLAMLAGQLPDLAVASVSPTAIVAEHGRNYGIGTIRVTDFFVQAGTSCAQRVVCRSIGDRRVSSSRRAS